MICGAMYASPAVSRASRGKGTARQIPHGKPLLPGLKRLSVRAFRGANREPAGTAP
jgi:hypothetical protein